jgi:hypothetical protein
MPMRKTWDSFMPHLVGTIITKDEFYVLEKLFSKYNPDWEKNPVNRINAHYALTKFEESRTKQQLADIEQVIGPILARAQRRTHLSQGRLSIAILNGYFGLDRQSEKPCIERPWADYDKAGIEGWQTALSDKPRLKVNVELIPMTDISPKFSIILNPFGEAYPELPSATGATPGYQMVKDYIYAGGVFITAGGNPFHYLFSVYEGQRHDTSTVIPNVPMSPRRVPDEQGNVVIEVQTTALLSDMFLTRDFGVGTTITPRDEHRKDYPVDAFQQPEDKKYWDCQVDVSQIRVFRSLYPPASGKPIPVLRAILSGEEVFPIAFVRYGFGFLLHIGLALTSDAAREFEVASKAVREGLIENFENYFLP